MFCTLAVHLSADDQKAAHPSLSPSPLPESENTKPKVGIMKFETAEGLEPSLGRFLYDSLMTDVLASKEVTVVDWEEIDRLLKYIAASQPNLTPEDARKQAVSQLGIQKMYIGSVVKVGAKFHITIKVLNLDLTVEQMEKITAENEDGLADATRTIARRILRLDLDILRQDFDRAFVELRDFAKARETADRLVKVGNRASDFALRGAAEMELELYEAAKKDFREAAEREPRKAQHFFNLSLAEEYLPSADEATASISKAIALQPQNPSYYLRRGELRLHGGHPKEAIADFSKALEIAPKEPRALTGRAQCYQQLENYQRADADVSEAIALLPSSAPLYLLRGSSAARQYNYSSALSDASKAIEISPGVPDGYTFRALTYVSVLSFDKALTDCNKAVELAPNSFAPLSWRAVVYLYAGELAQSAADATKSIELNPNPLAFTVRGVINAAKGDYLKAQEDFRQSLVKQQSSYEIPPSVFYLALVSIRLGETNVAELLNPYLEKREESAKADWWKALTSFLEGGVSVEGLLAMTADKNANLQREKECEACFFAGFVRITSDPTGGTELLRRCLETKHAASIEYAFAKAELSVRNSK